MNTVKLKEDLSVKNIKSFYDEIAGAIKGDSEVVLDFSEIERLDLSVIQVIMSALREVRNEGRLMKLKNVPASIRNQLNICGLLKTN